MVNKRTPPTVTAAPTPPLVLRSEQDAREAFGSGHGLETFFRQPAAAPLAIHALPVAGGVLPPLSTVAVEALPWLQDARWHCLEVSHDPQRAPPVSCRVDGADVELEQHLDGVWRRRRAESDG